MNYRDMWHAVIAAYRQRNLALCCEIADPFIESAIGEELGGALQLKADVMSQLDPSRSAEALILINEALRHLQGNPELLLRSVVTGLTVCNLTGDLERAREFEQLGHRTLSTHGDSPAVQSVKFRFFMNVGQAALQRGDYAIAYWHCTQAVSSLEAHGTDNGSPPERWLFWLHLHIAKACLELRRMPEAEEALDTARHYIQTEELEHRWILERAELLRIRRRYQEAEALLLDLAPIVSSCGPVLRTRFYLTRALIAEHRNDLRGFHQHLTLARQEALEHRLDYLLCVVQRIQRTPVRMGVE